MHRLTLLQMFVPALAALAGAAAGALLFGAAGAALMAAGGAALGAWLASGRAADTALAGSSGNAGTVETSAGGERLPAGYGRLLLEKLPVGILLIDRRGRVQFMNPTAIRLFGRRPPGQFHLTALRAPRLIEGIEASLASRQENSVTFGLARTGSSDLRASMQPLGADTGTLDGADEAPALAVLIEDLSQPRRAAELHRDFVANASHELKTPLASISGIIETLTGHARDDAEATERFLGLMAAQVERMKRLVQDLLSLNRIELNERVRPEEPQSVRRIAWEAAQVLEPMAAAEGVTLKCDPPAETPLVPGDRQELMQLFSNLIDNAIKYGGGGEVAVRAQRGVGVVGIAVTDNGPGIAREHLPRLTERFYRVSASHSRARGGTGLGLAIAKHIVNRHRGELKIESTPGEGSTFTVWLPILEAEVGRRPELAASRSA